MELAPLIPGRLLHMYSHSNVAVESAKEPVWGFSTKSQPVIPQTVGHSRGRPWDEHVTLNLYKSVQRKRLVKYVKYKALSFINLPGDAYWRDLAVCGFWRTMAKKRGITQGCAFWRVRATADHIYGVKSPKTTMYVRKLRESTLWKNYIENIICSFNSVTMFIIITDTALLTVSDITISTPFRVNKVVVDWINRSQLKTRWWSVISLLNYKNIRSQREDFLAPLTGYGSPGVVMTTSLGLTSLGWLIWPPSTDLWNILSVYIMLWPCDLDL